jgi:glyoxylase I family protein
MAQLLKPDQPVFNGVPEVSLRCWYPLSLARAVSRQHNTDLPDLAQDETMSIVTGFHHASLIVSDLQRSRPFYEGILGLVPSPARPDKGFDGVWYDIGHQQIHLLVVPNPDPVTGRAEHGGRDRHVALLVADLAAVRAELDEAGISYTLSKSGRAALFCRDPDGNAFELIQQAA